MTWSMALHPRSAVPSTAPQVRNHVCSNSGPLVPTPVCQPPIGDGRDGDKSSLIGVSQTHVHCTEYRVLALEFTPLGSHVPSSEGAPRWAPCPCGCWPSPSCTCLVSVPGHWARLGLPTAHREPGALEAAGGRTALGADGLAWLPRLRVPRSSGQSPDVLDAPQGGTCSSSTASCSTRGPGRAASSLSSGCLWTISCYLRTTGLWPLDSWRCVRAGPSLRDAWTPCGWGAPDSAFARLWGQDGATAGHILSPPLAPPQVMHTPTTVHRCSHTRAHASHTGARPQTHTPPGPRQLSVPLLRPESWPSEQPLWTHRPARPGLTRPVPPSSAPHRAAPAQARGPLFSGRLPTFKCL